MHKKKNGNALWNAMSEEHDLKKDGKFDVYFKEVLADSKLDSLDLIKASPIGKAGDLYLVHLVEIIIGQKRIILKVHN